MKLLNNPYYNLLAILGISAVSFGFCATTDKFNDIGMAFLFVLWLPVVVGLITLLTYLLSRLLFKKYNWVITILGCLVNLVFLIAFIFGE